MSSYIYNVFETLSQLDGPSLKFSSTRKYEARKFLQAHLEEGNSLAPFTVTRSRDGIKDTLTYVDVYEFMDIDLGEVI